jgi:Protein of unknown function (DUF1565)
MSLPGNRRKGQDETSAKVDHPAICPHATKLVLCLLCALVAGAARASEQAATPIGTGASPTANVIHVAKNGADSNKGTRDEPLLTIAAAARIAQPGDVVSVHEGTYREWVKPMRGGSGEDKRIIYSAARGEKVAIKGSERITNWTPGGYGVWKTEVPNSVFGDYNPYGLTVTGGWLEYGKWRHLGQVHLNGRGFVEVESSNELAATIYSWQAYVAESATVISANFGEGVDPNAELSEVTVRPCVFIPMVRASISSPSKASPPPRWRIIGRRRA